MLKQFERCSSLLQGLERRELVERRTESGNERSKRVFATPVGAELIGGLDTAMSEVDESILGPLDEASATPCTPSCRRSRRNCPKYGERSCHEHRDPRTTGEGRDRRLQPLVPLLRPDRPRPCAPMAAAMIVSAVYNVINAGFIGSLHNTALLAAITFGTPLLGLVMAVGGVFGVGGGALISRLLGASENEPATAGAGRGRRAPGDDRPDRLHGREPGVRRVVHPGAGSRSPPAC
jgi:hypothetical protein